MKDLYKQYVVGFMFSADLKRVALIRKKRPKWQEGLLNGIGGKIKEDEIPRQSMVREFLEETGHETTPSAWQIIHDMGGSDSDNEPFTVKVYTTVGDVDALVSKTDEPVEVVYVNSIHPNRADVVDNLCWLVAIAVNFLKTGTPTFTKSVYG